MKGLKPHIDIVWQRSRLHRFKINCYLCKTTVSRINGQGAQLVSIEINIRLLIKLLITLDLSVSVWLMSVSTCTVQLAVGLIPIYKETQDFGQPPNNHKNHANQYYNQYHQ